MSIETDISLIFKYQISIGKNWFKLLYLYWNWQGQNVSNFSFLGKERLKTKRKNWKNRDCREEKEDFLLIVFPVQWSYKHAIQDGSENPFFFNFLSCSQNVSTSLYRPCHRCNFYWFSTLIINFRIGDWQKFILETHDLAPGCF